MGYDYMTDLIEFHMKYRHYARPNSPHIPEQNIVELRQKLILEEAQEFSDACDAKNLVEIADALADLLYVTFGAALAFGIPIEEVFREVHRSNMTKSMLKDEKSIKGKTIKGPDWSPPDIATILCDHGAELT